MRWVLTAIVVVASGLLAAVPARAHGGAPLGKHGPTTKGGGGGGGGGGRTTGPVTETGTGIGGPIVSPGGTTPGTTDRRPASKRKRSVTQTFDLSWELWWQVNRPHYLWRRLTDLPTATVTPSGSEAQAQHRAKALTLLRQLVDPAYDVPPDVRASACLALAKVAPPKSVMAPLLELVLDTKAPDLVRESAALSLGLLRRTDVSQQLSAGELDQLRAKLLMLWDQRVDGQRVPLGSRARQFAMISLGLLGGQPFADQSKPGLLVSTLLWERVGFPFKKEGFREAVLLAMGHQPIEGTTTQIREGVRKIAAGNRVFGTTWHPRTRGYALTTLTTLQDTGAAPLLLKQLGDARQHPAVHLTALLVTDARRAQLPSMVRGMALRLIAQNVLARKQPLLVHGLALVTLGGLLGDELSEGKDASIRDAMPPIQRALDHKLWTIRGFAAIALGRAFRNTAHVGDRANAGRQLRQRFLAEKELSVRGALAVALGLMGEERARGDLRTVVASDLVPGELRAHAAVALALYPTSGIEERAAVARALGNRKLSAPVRAELARAAACLGGEEGADALLAQLKSADDVMQASAVATALGFFATPEALDALSALAADSSRSEMVRAMAVVAIGRMLDVEGVPSLARFTRGFVYPLWTDAMRELLTIL